MTIETAQEFVEQVAGASRESGGHYRVLLGDGTWHNLQDIMQRELDLLEVELRRVVMDEAVSGLRLRYSSEAATVIPTSTPIRHGTVITGEHS